MSHDFAYVSPEGVVRIKQRTWGNFSQPLDLRNSPFDQQALQIKLVAVDVSPEHIQLIQNSDRNSTVNLTSSVPDWKITDWNTASSTYSLPGLNATPPLFTLTVHIQRYTNLAHAISGIFFAVDNLPEACIQEPLRSTLAIL